MRVFVIAGEASGDKLGMALMAGLKEQRQDVEFRGIGGVAMMGEGLESLFPMDELSLMGIAEILPRYFHLKRRISQAAAAVLEWKPDVVVTIDAPDFCLRVAKLVKASSDIKVVHYVAPSVWAWRPGRAVKMARVVDHVLALLPFETPLMRAAGMGATFVGHPVVSEPVAIPNQATDFRKACSIGDAPLLLVLPGSRKGEISRLSPVLGDVLRRVVVEIPGLRVVVPIAPGKGDMVAKETRDWPGDPVLILPEDEAGKRVAFVAADAALAASGTVALELAAAGTPMVVAYDFNWLTRAILKRMMITDSVNLVNLVSDSRVVPEFLGKECRADLIAPGMLEVLRDPDAQKAAMRETMRQLGAGGEAPGLRAAKAVIEVVEGAA
ncbi:MAG: lipid-A-disaccharide synthase [Rhodobacteraceae bacterium]|nr:lipid-A-disaccharide synthase [Paracoccaceae bacterium]